MSKIKKGKSITVWTNVCTEINTDVEVEVTLEDIKEAFGERKLQELFSLSPIVDNLLDSVKLELFLTKISKIPLDILERFLKEY